MAVEPVISGPVVPIGGGGMAAGGGGRSAIGWQGGLGEGFAQGGRSIGEGLMLAAQLRAQQERDQLQGGIEIWKGMIGEEMGIRTMLGQLEMTRMGIEANMNLEKQRAYNAVAQMKLQGLITGFTDYSRALMDLKTKGIVRLSDQRQKILSDYTSALDLRTEGPLATHQLVPVTDESGKQTGTQLVPRSPSEIVDGLRKSQIGKDTPMSGDELAKNVLAPTRANIVDKLTRAGMKADRAAQLADSAVMAQVGSLANTIRLGNPGGEAWSSSQEDTVRALETVQQQFNFVDSAAPTLDILHKESLATLQDYQFLNNDEQSIAALKDVHATWEAGYKNLFRDSGLDAPPGEDEDSASRENRARRKQDRIDEAYVEWDKSRRSYRDQLISQKRPVDWWKKNPAPEMFDPRKVAAEAEAAIAKEDELAAGLGYQEPQFGGAVQEALDQMHRTAGQSTLGAPASRPAQVPGVTPVKTPSLENPFTVKRSPTPVGPGSPASARLSQEIGSASSRLVNRAGNALNAGVEDISQAVLNLMGWDPAVQAANKLATGLKAAYPPVKPTALDSLDNLPLPPIESQPADLPPVDYSSFYGGMK